jgi:carboxyl-terminal processing protease
LLHIDTGYKFKEMIDFRDEFAASIGARLIVHRNEEAIANRSHPLKLGVARCCGAHPVVMNRFESGISDENLALLAEALGRVRREYVDAIDEDRLVADAINGMLEGLDRHSRYLDHDQYEDIRIATTGNYSGVGLSVTLRDGRVMVDSSLENAPADAAGILAGDVVVSVDDVPIGAESVEAAINRMRGLPGTEVRLRVLRGDEETPLEFTLTRRDIHVNTVRSALLTDGLGYLHLSGFSESTVAELVDAANALTELHDGSLNGLVLDLRNNPGGVLQAAIGVADVFLDDGLIVRGSGRIRQSQFAEYAEPGDELESVPLVVLINAGSASGSEIVAGALKDHGRATLVGERSYGKGSVQSVVPLGEGSALKLTTALYLTPSGTSINGRGIDPDRLVEFSERPQAQYRGTGSRVAAADDPQLSRALELLVQ